MPFVRVVYLRFAYVRLMKYAQGGGGLIVPETLVLSGLGFQLVGISPGGGILYQGSCWDEPRVGANHP